MNKKVGFDYALDWMSNETVLNALSMVKQGKVYDLGNTMSRDMPMGSRETFDSFRISQYRLPAGLVGLDTTGFDFAMDTISCSPHLGTHIDCFSHVQNGGKTFQGEKTTDLIGRYGWKKFTAESVPPIFLRGVLIDLPKFLGVDIVPDETLIDEKMLAEAVETLGVEIHTGDAVLVRTGKQAEFLAGDENYFNRQCGIVGTGSKWLYEQGMALLGSDTSATDPTPMVQGNDTHTAMMVERGVHLIEIMDLDALARDGVKEFCFIGLPLKIKGTTGTWIRPVALA